MANRIWKLAEAAARKYRGYSLSWMWVRGREAGLREARKRTKVLIKEAVHAAYAHAGAHAEVQMERARVAEHEWNIKRIKLEREIRMNQLNEEKRNRDVYRRAAALSAIETRQANYGGFSR